jgi:hypothetical protein
VVFPGDEDPATGYLITRPPDYSTDALGVHTFRGIVKEIAMVNLGVGATSELPSVGRRVRKLAVARTMTLVGTVSSFGRHDGAY